MRPRIPPLPTPPRRWRRLPARTIRLRLTALYGSLFLACGAGLLTITYFLVKHRYSGNFFVSVQAHGSAPGILVAGGAGGQQSGSFTSGGAAGGSGPVGPGTSLPTPGQVITAAHRDTAAALGALFVQSGIALAIMAVIAIGLGWIVAGRVLRPLRTMTATARQISEQNLHERLAVAGPDDELKQLGNTIDELLERLEASFEAQRQFVANASHELRTPLTLERTLVEVALADPDATIDTLRHMGERVLATGTHQEQLIEALLTLSRSQRGLDEHQPVDLAATTQAALQTIDHDGLTITSDLRPAWASGDPALLERLVTNVISNALHHNLPGGHITAETTTVSGRATLTVTNTGPPVPPTELKRLFQPFQRLDTHRATNTNGVGLGLSIIRAIADAHNATLDVQPQPQGGLEFTITFPTPTPLANDTAVNRPVSPMSDTPTPWCSKEALSKALGNGGVDTSTTLDDVSTRTEHPPPTAARAGKARLGFDLMNFYKTKVRRQAAAFWSLEATADTPAVVLTRSAWDDRCGQPRTTPFCACRR